MKRLFAIALLFAGLAARAQETPTVTARVEPDSIMIGDRFDYVIDVEKDLVQVVEFPVFDPRDGKIELVENCPVDTLERDGRHLRLRKRYTLAAFEEGKWNLGLPAVLYADKNIVDTLRARDSLYLEVATFQIDSTSQSIYDLKPQRNLPFRFAEVSGYAKWGVLALLLAEQMQVDACIPISAPMATKNRFLCLSGVMGKVIPRISWGDHPERSVALNADYDFGYTGFPTAKGADLYHLIRLARKNLFNITCPVLAVQSEDDETIWEGSADCILNGVSSEKKWKLWLHGVPHVCTISQEEPAIRDGIVKVLEQIRQ